ncbi:amidohydrolase [Rhodosalinus halophilus]|uniref:Amidohydrolase n=1 Tax=Rhodosalinus halophilus TaxID=2259333 RepID=A0A365U809_9RHOB|nr:amidohydrolase family protein [Rhodosalinus halophilus]RBI84966.1 amidohydrolase [Rhodosalinus halophilus]
MSIVDAHFHIWRRADLPWLDGPMQPRIFGAYEGIRRDYPVGEYLGDIAGTGVTRAVYVQANWPPERAEDEAAWIESVADDSGWPHAQVAYADMTADDLRPALDRLARFPRLRGIRQQFHWHETPAYRFAPQPDLCRDRVVQRNVARLADDGLVFELQVFAGQMAGACALADACPDTTLVLQHAGMLEDTSDEGRAAWRDAMAALAERPNVTAKLSGFGTFIHRVDPAHIAWLIEETVALFGADRCLWGSNFPIEKLWTDYATLLAAHRHAAAGLSAAQQNAIFNDTACRVYRLT